MIFQESLCLWDVLSLHKQTSANIDKGTLNWAMGLLGNLSMATRGAGVRNMWKNLRVMILIYFPVISVDLKSGSSTKLTTFPVPQSSCAPCCKEKNIASKFSSNSKAIQFKDMQKYSHHNKNCSLCQWISLSGIWDTIILITFRTKAYA